MRSATGQKARVRAKCVRAKVVRCGVRACGQKSVTPNTLGNRYLFSSKNVQVIQYFSHVSMEVRTLRGKVYDELKLYGI